MQRDTTETINQVMWVTAVCFVIMTGFTFGSPKPGYKFYSKSDWGAEPATDVHPLKTPVPYVVIHHTYIPGACNTTEQCKASMRSMQKFHQSQDWGDIGYNFAVGGEGGVYEGRGWDVLGIHAGKANNYSLGIVLIGDFRTELPPPQQLATTLALIRDGVSRGVICPEYKLVGHGQVMATECPGGALYAHIQKWKHYVPEFVLPSKKINLWCDD